MTAEDPMSPGRKRDATHAEHLGAGLSCAVEPAAWH